MSDGWVACPGCGTPNSAYGDYMCGKCESKYAKDQEKEKEFEVAERAYDDAFVTCYISRNEVEDKPSETMKKVRCGVTKYKGLARKKYKEASKLIVNAIKKKMRIPYPNGFFERCITW